MQLCILKSHKCSLLTFSRKLFHHVMLTRQIKKKKKEQQSGCDLWLNASRHMGASYFSVISSVYSCPPTPCGWLPLACFTASLIIIYSDARCCCLCRSRAGGTPPHLPPCCCFLILLSCCVRLERVSPRNDPLNHDTNKMFLFLLFRLFGLWNTDIVLHIMIIAWLCPKRLCMWQNTGIFLDMIIGWLHTGFRSLRA